MFAAWAPKGGQLYYESLDGHLQVVDSSVNGTTFEAGKPRLWSNRQLQNIFKSNMTIAPDGRHFAYLSAGNRQGRAQGGAADEFPR